MCKQVKKFLFKEILIYNALYFPIQKRKRFFNSLKHEDIKKVLFFREVIMLSICY